MLLSRTKYRHTLTELPRKIKRGKKITIENISHIQTTEKTMNASACARKNGGGNKIPKIVTKQKRET